MSKGRNLVVDPSGWSCFFWQPSRHWLVMCPQHGEQMRTELRRMVRDDVAAVTDKVVAAEMKNETLIEHIIEMKQRQSK